MTKVLSLRVEDDLADWATAYADSRGVTRQALLEEGLRSFKADCEAGVPEIRAKARAQTSVKDAPEDGVGKYPKRVDGKGHVWKSWKVDPFKSCEFCGLHGREPAQGAVPGYTGPQGGGYFATAGRARLDLFDGLRAPASSHGQKKS
jgi:hypothetical protein